MLLLICEDCRYLARPGARYAVVCAGRIGEDARHVEQGDSIPVRSEGLYGHPVRPFSGRSPSNRLDRGPDGGFLGVEDRPRRGPSVDGWSMAMAMVDVLDRGPRGRSLWEQSWERPCELPASS